MSLALKQLNKHLWTAHVHLLTPPAEHGNTRCYTNVVAWGTDKAEFHATVRAIFARRFWTILGIENCRPAVAAEAVNEEHAEQIERASSEPGSCIFGTLHYYPSRTA